MTTHYLSKKACVLFILALSSAGPAIAEMTLIEASRDNTLYESEQGLLSNGSGDYLFVGRTRSNGVRRAVIAFDDLSSIPPGSIIDSVRLNLQLSKETSSPTTLSVWRLVSDWGEGASDADGEEGGGTTAAEGDATWVYTFFDSQTWLSPGGDFMEGASGELAVDSVGNYTIESTEGLINDVQEWLDDPEANFGWVLTAVEDGTTTAKRFNSRENPDSSAGPLLEVTYTPPPEDEKNNNWSGAWFDPSLNGEGYQIFDTPVGWVIYFFGYTPDEEQLWLVSRVADIGDPELDKSYSLQMLVGTPGTFNNPSPPEQLVDWGTLEINFTDCNNGLFVLESPTLSLLKISSVSKIVGVDGAGCVNE
jgi:hypothetical protein